jgi:hypothetical protein
MNKPIKPEQPVFTRSLTGVAILNSPYSTYYVDAPGAALMAAINPLYHIAGDPPDTQQPFELGFVVISHDGQSLILIGEGDEGRDPPHHFVRFPRTNPKLVDLAKAELIAAKLPDSVFQRAQRSL